MTVMTRKTKSTILKHVNATSITNDSVFPLWFKELSSKGRKAYFQDHPRNKFNKLITASAESYNGDLIEDPVIPGVGGSVTIPVSELPAQEKAAVEEAVKPRSYWRKKLAEKLEDSKGRIANMFGLHLDDVIFSKKRVVATLVGSDNFIRTYMKLWASKGPTTAQEFISLKINSDAKVQRFEDALHNALKDIDVVSKLSNNIKIGKAFVNNIFINMPTIMDNKLAKALVNIRADIDTAIDNNKPDLGEEYLDTVYKFSTRLRRDISSKSRSAMKEAIDQLNNEEVFSLFYDLFVEAVRSGVNREYRKNIQNMLVHYMVEPTANIDDTDNL